jgi:hypothetical protein
MTHFVLFTQELDVITVRLSACLSGVLMIRMKYCPHLAAFIDQLWTGVHKMGQTHVFLLCIYLFVVYLVTLSIAQTMHRLMVG